jgi:ATP-binding cassette subfamily B protein
VVERGSHDDLVAAGGLYATLWAIQTGTVDALSPAALARVERASDGADADD